MNATITSVQIDEATGFLFESTKGNGICFVPEGCVRFEPDGQISFDDGGYLLSGWARRNGRFNFSVAGHRLFPSTKAVLCDLDAPEVFEFLTRVRHPEFQPIEAK